LDGNDGCPFARRASTFATGQMQMNRALSVDHLKVNPVGFLRRLLNAVFIEQVYYLIKADEFHLAVSRRRCAVSCGLWTVRIVLSRLLYRRSRLSNNRIGGLRRRTCLSITTLTGSKPIRSGVLMRTVLFVCTGNTCRSPMAEAIARS